MHLAVKRVAAIALTALLGLTLLGAAPAAAEPTFRTKVIESRPNPAVRIRGSGWGHSVGMSQYGAYAMAQAGKTATEILTHYYRGTAVAPGVMPDNIRVGLHNAMEASDIDAVSGNVRWATCSGGECTRVKIQPEGTTWRVQLMADGTYRLREGDTKKWRGGEGKRLVANFNPNANADGSVIRAFNPNGMRRQYKWGRMEYSVRSTDNRTMFMVLDIPSMEYYLRGLGEVPNSWGVKGPAALRAQAITGRTYALGLHNAFAGNRSDCRCSVLATPANQAYTGYDKELADYSEYWVDAVNATAGIVATYEGKLISTYYSSSHGGRSENSEDSWAYSAALPYLRSVDDSWSLQPSSGNPLASWERTVSNPDLARFVGNGMNRVRSIKISGRTDGGSPKSLIVTGLDSSGRAVSVTRTGKKGIVGIDLRAAFSFTGRVNLGTLPSQQVKSLTFGPFEDDNGSPHEYSIIYASEAGIMNGVSTTEFNPGGDVTRADMALFLYRTFKIPESSKDYFSDDDGHPAEDAINAVAEAGIASGVTATRFAPGRTLNRMQMASFFRNALGISAGSTDHFDDDDGLVHEGSINAVARKEIVAGCGTRKFCPKAKIKRGQMATFLYATVEAYR